MATTSDYAIRQEMADEKFCSGCRQRHDCKSTYEKLGKVKGESVFLKSVGAFLVPILLFIISLAVFEPVFESWISGKNARTAICALAGAGVCYVYLVIITGD